ncbi:hypothetical protein DE146DRAFT_773184 [Phaeosphaeria sp. MPI-PUGE-AT-0046c]|nr:hypothetical protein DE146DRAFT_773184 [Phaeosphaeria sp. MPI-PUGE-AT-0046c]
MPHVVAAEERLLLKASTVRNLKIDGVGFDSDYPCLAWDLFDAPICSAVHCRARVLSPLCASATPLSTARPVAYAFCALQQLKTTSSPQFSPIYALCLHQTLSPSSTPKLYTTEDIVRYRIKHTGNRKPQLVTTDFDVIEDMLVKDWDMIYSFDIRYKHLLVNRNKDEVDDETINHIMDASPDHDDDYSDDDDDDHYQIIGEDKKVDNGRSGRAGVSKRHRQSINSSEAPQYSSTRRSHHHPKESKAREHASLEFKLPPQGQVPQQPSRMYGHGAAVRGCGPPLDSWGRPMVIYGGLHAYNNGCGGFDYHGGYDYALQDHGARCNSRSPSHGMPYYLPHLYAMTPALGISDYKEYGNNHYKRERDISLAASKRAGDTYESLPPCQSQDTMIKRESTADEEPSFYNDRSILIKDLGDLDDVVEDEDALDAEVEAMELELKLAKLKAARLQKKHKRQH